LPSRQASRPTARSSICSRSRSRRSEPPQQRQRRAGLCIYTPRIRPSPAA
jgi:hypothetical protein